MFEEQLRNMEFVGISLTEDQLSQIAKAKPKGVVFKECNFSEQNMKDLAQCVSIVNLTMKCCELTDSHIRHLACLPKLTYLFLSANSINGDGFVDFAGHKKLNVVWLDDNPFGDDGLKALALLPKMSTIRIANTKVTFAGLLAVADNYKLSVCVDDRKTKLTLFTKDQMDEFERLQRHLAKKKKEADPLLVVEAEEALCRFFQSYSEFERFASEQENVFSDEVKERYRQLLANYCSVVNHQNRLSSLSTSSPYTFGGHSIVDNEQLSKTKIYIYTKNSLDNLYRTLLILEDGKWVVDSQQWMYEGWTKSSF